jgi:hypothetical protein
MSQRFSVIRVVLMVGTVFAMIPLVALFGAVGLIAGLLFLILIAMAK